MNDINKSALRLAIEANDSTLALQLIRERPSDLKEPLLSLAIKLNQVEIASALIKAEVNLDDPDKEGLTPLYRALTVDNSIFWVQILLTAGANPNAQVGLYKKESILNRVVGQSSPEVVALLIDSEADVNQMDERGNLPLVEAAYKPEIVKLLLKAGADVNRLDQHKQSPLNKAARQRSLESVQVLLQAGADSNALSNEVPSPLECAAAGGVLEIMDTLIAAGANINQRSLQKTLQAGLIGGEAATGFFKRISSWPNDEDVQDVDLDKDLGDICKIYSKTSREPRSYIEVVNKLLDMGADVRQKGDAVLLHPAGSGQIEVMRSLIRAGADVNDHYTRKSPDFPGTLNAGDYSLRDGSTALHRAAHRGNMISILELLNQGADINSRDDGGVTPLMTSAFYRHPRVVKLLLRAGADRQATDCEGNTALTYARKEFCTECVELLE